MLALIARLNHWIWEHSGEGENRWQRGVRHSLKILVMIVRDLSAGMITLRAMSLVYTTLLSLVPLLAVSFSVLKGFGVHNQIEPFLLNLLHPLGEKSVEITNNIVGFVENMKIGVLGTLGLAMLLYTVVSLIQKIEAAFNFTWRIQQSRNLSQRFSNYLSVILVGPVLIFSAIGIMASLQSDRILERLNDLPFGGHLIQLIGVLLPYFMIIGAFTFVYILIPNTRVRLRSAFIGAIVAGLLWRWAGTLFASFMGGSTSYTAIYSGFAIVLLFMIWLYIGWMILLVGASIAYYDQYPERMRWQRNEPRISAVLRENLCLSIMLETARAHLTGDLCKINSHDLAAKLNAPEFIIQHLIKSLTEGGLLTPASIKKCSGFLPSRSIDTISVYEIFQVSRNADDFCYCEALQRDPSIIEIDRQHKNLLQSTFAQVTLKQLLESNNS